MRFRRGLLFTFGALVAAVALFVAGFLWLTGVLPNDHGIDLPESANMVFQERGGSWLDGHLTTTLVVPGVDVPAIVAQLKPARGNYRYWSGAKDGGWQRQEGTKRFYFCASSEGDVLIVTTQPVDSVRTRVQLTTLWN